MKCHPPDAARRELMEMELEFGQTERAAAAASLMPLLSASGRQLVVPSTAADLPAACPDSFRRRSRMISALGTSKDDLLRAYATPATLAASPAPPLEDVLRKEQGRAAGPDSLPAEEVSAADESAPAAAAADSDAGAADAQAAAEAGKDSPPGGGQSGRPAPLWCRCSCCARPPVPGPGPGGSRACRDVPWLVALALVWAGWAVLGWAAFSAGCPDRCNDPRQMVIPRPAHCTLACPPRLGPRARVRPRSRRLPRALRPDPPPPRTCARCAKVCARLLPPQRSEVSCSGRTWFQPAAATPQI